MAKNLGKKTSMKKSGGPSKDAYTQVGKKPINPGPGGTQRP